MESFRRNFRPIATGSDKLKQAIAKESRMVVKLSFVYLALIVALVIMYMPWIGDEDKIYFLINLFETYLRNDLLKKFLMALILPFAFHAAYSTNIPMFTTIYFMLHIKYQIALLTEKVEGINLPVHETVAGLIINDVNYQKKIKQRLIACVQHHQDIKR